jgi:tetratricopeptide (TPR) repeat protein
MLPTLTALTELRERSLILVEEGEDGGETMRFRMLETLREFALEQQTVAVETEIRQRHALSFLHLAETSQTHLSGAQQRDWLRRLEADHDNLRQALAWAAATGSLVTGLRLGIALTSFWDTRGYAAEGQEWLARLLALQQEETNDRAARALRAQALNSCALLARSLARFVEAERYVESALELWRELDSAQGRAVSLQLLATLAYSRENYADARRLAEEALALTEQTGDAAGAAGARTNLGNIAMEQRRWDDAWELFSESLRQHQADGNLKRAANALNNLGLTARYRGDMRTARALLEQSLAICRDLADKSGTAISLLNLGAVARLEGRFDAAHNALKEAALLAIESDSKRALAWCARERGHLACAEHAFETGTRLLAAAEDLKLALGMSFNPADPEELTQCSAQARAALGNSAFDALWTSSGHLPLAEAYRKVTTLLNAPTDGEK